MFAEVNNSESLEVLFVLLAVIAFAAAVYAAFINRIPAALALVLVAVVIVLFAV